MALRASPGLRRKVTSRAVEIPYTAKTVLQFPLLLCVIAVFAYGFAYAAYRNTGRPSLFRYVAFLFAILGIVAGLQQVWKLQNPDTGLLYRNGLRNTPRVLYAHYVAPVLPLILLIVLFIADLRLRKKAKADALYEEDED